MQKVGNVTPEIAALLGMELPADTSIMLGDSNIQHMKNRHPKDYQKYSAKIPEILSHPDYVGCNQKDQSIEYVKEYLIDDEYVKVAVRISGSGTLFARTLYTLNKNRVKNFIDKGTLKRVP